MQVPLCQYNLTVGVKLSGQPLGAIIPINSFDVRAPLCVLPYLGFLAHVVNVEVVV